MHLTKEEERIYDGEHGWAYQISMKILVKLGDLYGAKRLIPIESAHISGISYKTVGESPIEFLKALVDSGGKVAVKATTNPSSIDSNNMIFNLLPKEYVERQREIISLYSCMGLETTLTCTPYYLEQPKSGSHLSWAESSAVIYANSILNSWTNREGGPSALASALLGRTPDYGIHQPENRYASILVKVDAGLDGDVDYGVLGIHLGKIIGDKIPLIRSLPSDEESLLKQLGAAMATSGMTPMFHVDRSGEEASNIEEKISVDEECLKNAYEILSSPLEEPDLIFIGCPHCSLDEIKKIATLLEGKRVRPNLKLWVCTSRHIRDRSKRYVDIIEAAGGQVICDTCAVVTWLRELGIESVITNSAKTAYYVPLMSKVRAMLSPLEKCIKIACST